MTVEPNKIIKEVITGTRAEIKEIISKTNKIGCEAKLEDREELEIPIEVAEEETSMTEIEM